jgi:hypothetical protein
VASGSSLAVKQNAPGRDQLKKNFEIPKIGNQSSNYPRSLKGPRVSGVDQEIKTWCRRTGSDLLARDP